MSTNRTDLSSYDVILFHFWSINPNDLPQQVYDHQKWVLYTLESPSQTRIGLNYTGLKKVDWIMSYRTDSNVYTPYGKVIKKCKKKWKRKYKYEGKTKSIAWFVSHCKTSSNRLGYAQELSKYIDVDIYGECGPFKCERLDTKQNCNHMIARNYMFYLSFENSICKDYVTEKLFKYIEYDIIPIVMGGANYSQILPRNSYIDVFNFSSPKHLANYLKIVKRNKTLYNSYFKWKKRYCISKSFGLKNNYWKYFGRPCKLCHYIENRLNKPTFSTIDQFRMWWISGSNCKTIMFEKEVMKLVNYTIQPQIPPDFY